MKLISQKRINMVSFSNWHKSVQPTEAITGYIYFCLHSYPIYGPVPEEKQCDLSHVLGASVPSDKSPSAPLSTASGCTWEPWLVTTLRSFLLHFSRFRMNLKSIIHCNKPVLPNRLTQRAHFLLPCNHVKWKHSLQLEAAGWGSSAKKGQELTEKCLRGITRKANCYD